MEREKEGERVGERWRESKKGREMDTEGERQEVEKGQKEE